MYYVTITIDGQDYTSHPFETTQEADAHARRATQALKGSPISYSITIAS